MFTDITWQDWQAAPEAERPALLLKIIRQYKASADFRAGLDANAYFRGDNPAIAKKTVVQARVVETKDASGRTHKRTQMQEIAGNRIHSNCFQRFVTQQNQYLLGNGVTLENDDAKRRLGEGFDKRLEGLGEKALKHGVAWGFWNVDHLEEIEAVADGLSGFVALLDERTSTPRVGVQFWQLNADRPIYVRLFEADGLTEYRQGRDGLEVVMPKRAYRVTTATDALGTTVTGQENYAWLPVIPFYANGDKRSELTPAIKSKIDVFDRILSDFADNLDRANDVYWVLNNFGGTMDEIAEVLEQISRIKAVANVSDGTGGASTVEPHTIEVPYEARRQALDILRKELHKDYMALDMDALTGGSLTNVAIETAMLDLNLKADRYEWQAFSFVQRVLALIGVQTEEIRFKRQTIVNRSEIVGDIGVMRDYVDMESALKLNPYINQEEVDDILARKAAETMSYTPPAKEEPDA